jgi:hypothetical protein
MLNEKETNKILEEFFYECVAFWNRTINDTCEAFKNAIRDIEELNRNPYDPCGKLLNVIAKDKFISCRRRDLNIFQI